MLKKEMEVECLQEFFWTDSVVIVWYTKNETRRFHVFLTNCVEHIKPSTAFTQCKYVALEENPVDQASRGLTAEHLVASNWFTGPGFLWQDELPTSDAYEPRRKCLGPNCITVVLK